jgi:hypothetical protein
MGDACGVAERRWVSRRGIGATKSSSFEGDAAAATLLEYRYNRL